MKFKKILYFLLITILIINKNLYASDSNIYEKIDTFSEVLDKINKEYVDDINQSEAMDAAINGVLQSLLSWPSILQFVIPLILNFSKTCSDKAWICLEDVPLAIII